MQIPDVSEWQQNVFRTGIILTLVSPVHWGHVCDYSTCPAALSLEDGSFGISHLRIQAVAIYRSTSKLR